MIDMEGVDVNTPDGVVCLDWLVGGGADAMPDAMADLYYPLWAEVGFLRMVWKTYHQMFGTGESLIVGVKTAPAFFALLQDMSHDYMTMGVSRLTDPATTGRRKNVKKNLTLAALVDAIPTDSVEEAQMKARAGLLVQEARTQSARLREHRNRRVAHSDLATLLDTHSVPLCPAEDEDFGRAIEAITKVLVTVNGFYAGEMTTFGDILMNGDGNTVIELLRRGLGTEMTGRVRA